MDSYVFNRRSRSRRSVFWVSAYVILLVVLLIFFQAAWWLILGLSVPLLPALWELWHNPAAGLSLDDEKIFWFTKSYKDQMGFDEVKQVRLDTRWDFSVRVTLVPHHGKTVRLPHETLPPHRRLEQEFELRGLKTVRHHFNVISS